MEKYLDEIYRGHGPCGVEAAAWTHFRQGAGELG
ncbi:MAG TPA: hypothetical protein DCM14_06680 [Clostridiales bacterium UBA8153]|nr:hypothetical protein [Clostridiales bacterium UBA8153]